MRSFHRSVVAFAGLGALAGTDARPVVVAQTPTVAITQDALVGHWVRVLDTDTNRNKRREGMAEWAGQRVAYYLTLNADGTSKAYIEVNGVRDSTLGGWVIYMGERAGNGGQWTVRGDTIKAGRDGWYTRYRVALEGTTLALSTAGYINMDHTRHEQCTQIFIRVEAGKPLPGLSAKDGCQIVAGALPVRPLKATELVGTWVAQVDSMPIGADTGRGRRLDVCGQQGRCMVLTYDTLVFRADSVLLHQAIEVSPAQPNGVSNRSTVPELQWWIANDTLWVEWEMKTNGKPVKYVYNGDGKRVPAQPIRQAIPAVRLEDDGQYLVYQSKLYRRVTPSAP